MLALALLPTVSQALAFAQGGKSTWAEVCTTQGMKLVALDDAPGAGNAPAQPAAHLDHCPYCSLGASALGLPPAPMSALGLPAAAAHVPPLFLQAPRTLFAWRSALARAPPLAS
jgi:hypothetical protein